MSNSFEVKSIYEIQQLANKLCNTVDGAMQISSSAMADYACHSAFKHMGKLQEAFEALSKARSLLSEASKLDEVAQISEKFNKAKND